MSPQQAGDRPQTTLALFQRNRSKADICSAKGHVRFTPRKRTLCGPSKSAFGYRFMSTRPNNNAVAGGIDLRSNHGHIEKKASESGGVTVYAPGRKI
jgi:hypothetical protein